MFEFLRKFLLLMLLFVVGLSTYLSAQNATDWNETLWVQVYPINGDGLDTTAIYINQLDDEDFLSIERFMQREAQRYGVQIERPVKMILGEQVSEIPPPAPVGGNFLEIGYWSLKLRWWSASMTRDHPGPQPDISLFLVYFDPAETQSLQHSVGLQKGRVGFVNVFASRRMAPTNHFVIAHEMLHTLGATDKYAIPSLLPRYPDGFADPEKTPLYPQAAAEVMGGRIPLTETTAEIPRSLKVVAVGAATAAEIRWLR